MKIYYPGQPITMTGCESCDAQYNPISRAYNPDDRAPVNAHYTELPGGAIAIACYCEACGGDDRALTELDEVRELFLGDKDAYVIDVWNCRCAVARYEYTADGELTLKLAKNWEELEDQAAEAVEAQGGAFNLSGRYRCPPDLAALAVWDKGEESGVPKSKYLRSLADNSDNPYTFT